MALGDPRLMPAKYVPGLERWIKEGIEPGGFLQAVLKNDLFNAIAKADQVSQMALEFICGWLSCHAPAPCFGSEKNYKEWLKRGGMPEWNFNYDTSDVQA